jgi:capsid portal protein
MKKLKFLFPMILMGLLSLTMNSCKKCKNEDPRARVINNGTNNASVQIKTSNGNTVNINNVDPGTSSPYSSYAPGIVTYTIKVSGIDYVKTVDMTLCYDYDIAIDGNNNITSLSIDRND